MAEGARLESVYTATYRGFESPPHRHIQERARTKVQAFFALSPPSIAGWRHSSRAPYPVYISAAPPGNNTTIRLPILAKNFSEFYFAPLV